MAHALRLLLVLLLIVVSPRLSTADPVIPGGALPPACTAGSLSSYIALAGGCSVDEFTYSSFGFWVLIGTATSPATQVASPDAIYVAPPSVILDLLKISSPEFLVGGSDRVVYLLHYLLDAPSAVLPGYGIEMFAESPIGPGRAEARAFLCPGGVGVPIVDGSTSLVADLACGSGGALSPFVLDVFHNGSPEGNRLRDSAVFSGPTSQLDVWIQLDLDARLGGSSVITGIGNEVPYLAAEVVPEPGSMALIGIGLSALAVLRRANRKHS